MPLVNASSPSRMLTSEQKGQILERLTDAMVSIEGENMRGATWVRSTAATGASVANRSAPRTSRRYQPERRPSKAIGARRLP